MKKKEGAVFADSIYLTLEHKQNEEKNTKKINQFLDNQGYGDWEVDSDYYDTEVYALKNDTTKEVVIVHRGTDGSNKGGRRDAEVRADLYGVALGKQKGDKNQNSEVAQFYNSRTEKSENIVNGYDGTGYKIYLTGHSLGGSTAMNTMETSNVVRDGVSKAKLYNSGASPFFAERRVGKKKKESLDGKVINYRTKNDVVSLFLIPNTRYGNTITKETTATRVAGFLPLGAGLGLMGATALQAHSLENWYNREGETKEQRRERQAQRKENQKRKGRPSNKKEKLASLGFNS
tara:strand:+ start:2362 stop:3231 length:870 start_codon:yes stop_codon:yes gene_type:complete